MRVISGKLGGRVFDTPNSRRTHPMSDKVKGALFNILGDIEGKSVLDAFAGSGALSIEAVSRGAIGVVAIDNSQDAQKAIITNLNKLEITNAVKVIKASANSWFRTNTDARFDLVLCDPPYDELQIATLVNLSQVVSDNGTFVLSWPSETKLPYLDGLELSQSRVYGDATLAFYRRIG